VNFVLKLEVYEGVVDFGFVFCGRVQCCGGEGKSQEGLPFRYNKRTLTGVEAMRKALLLLGTFCLVSFADEVNAYKAGWVDGFGVGYSLKQARQVDIPAGYWLYLPTEDLPMPLVGFYVFSAQRLGLKAYLTDREVVFGVFQRRADAEFYREQLLGKGIDGVLITERRGQTGYEGSVLVLDKAGEERRGVSGVIYHLSKAVEKAKEIDPTVLNTVLLVEDLEKILKEVSKWGAGGKGYQRIIPEDKEEKQKLDIIEKFLKER
jgi:hypothetical protein